MKAATQGLQEPIKSEAERLDQRESLDAERIKHLVRTMIAERDQKAVPVEHPSLYWKGFASRFAYLFDLTEESLRHLRLHTYHLTADNYMTYDLGIGPERWRQNQGFDTMYAGLPEQLHLNEPEPGIGHRFPDGRFLSSDIGRFQRVVRTLHMEGILERLQELQAQRGRPAQILEIGGGYGGLALHLSRILPGCKYTIVDLPETLLFSAAYLRQHGPSQDLQLYDGSEPFAKGAADQTTTGFWLMPNHRLDLLDEASFDLIINVESLQELSEAQVTMYLDFIKGHLDGPFYCWNQDRNPSNTELSSLYALLDERFSRKEVQPPTVHGRARLESFLRRAARFARLMDVSTYGGDITTRENICLQRT